MPNTRSFSRLRDEARRSPERAHRIDAAKERAVAELSSCRLGELRKALGVTQVELAALIGRSQSAVSQIESGEIGLSLDVLRSIVRQLGGEIEIAAVFNGRRILIET
jgi:DNA-binding XRE family transcriptional regulator